MPVTRSGVQAELTWGITGTSASRGRSWGDVWIYSNFRRASGPAYWLPDSRRLARAGGSTAKACVFPAVESAQVRLRFMHEGVTRVRRAS